MNTPDNTNDNTDKKGKLLFPSLIIYFQFAKIMHRAISIRWSKLITTIKGKIFKLVILVLLLLLSRFSRVWLCTTPQTAAHQAPPSLGFPRQKHWSGLPFPSPMHESENWKWSHSNRVWLFTTPWTAAHQAPPSMGFSRKEYWSGLPLPSLNI